MKNILLIVLSLLTIGVQGQTLKTFTGNLGDGKITFTYYEDEKGNEIRHGVFKYTQYDSQNGASYSAVYTGNFKNGFKNGTWNYLITQVDNPQGNVFNTGTTKMAQTYTDGMPNGAWNYVVNIKIRAKRYSANGWSWSAYEQIPGTTINVNFREGVLAGLLRIKTPYLDISGQLNNHGLWTGRWIFKESNWQQDYDLLDGVLKKAISRMAGRVTNLTNYDAELLQLQDQASKLSGEELLSFCRQHKLKTKTIEGTAVYNLDDDYFDNQIFLGREIRGDKTYIFDKYDNRYNKRDYGRYMKIERAEIIPLSQISGYSSSRNSDYLRIILKENSVNLSDADTDRLLAEIKAKAAEETAYKENIDAKPKLNELLEQISGFVYKFKFVSLLKKNKSEEELITEALNNINSSYSVAKPVDNNSAWNYVFDKSITSQRQIIGKKYQFNSFSQAIKNTIPKPVNYRSNDENFDYITLLRKAEQHMKFLQKECAPRFQELLTLNDLYSEVSKSMDTIYDNRYYNKNFTVVYLAYKDISTELLDKISKTTDLAQLFDTAKQLKNICQATIKLRETDTKVLAKELKRRKYTAEKETLILNQ